MESLNSQMTGDPNQPNRPSVFAFNPYQQTGVDPSSWGKFQVSQMAYSGPPHQNPTSNIPIQEVPQLQTQLQSQAQQQFQAQQFLGNYTTPPSTPLANNYGAPRAIGGNFSFGSAESRPTSYPVQFPFPSSSSAGTSNAPTPTLPAMPPMSPTRGAFGSNLREISGHATRTSSRTSFVIPHPSQRMSLQSSGGMFMQYRGKRKNDDPTLQPVKQHITEQVMIEHMSKLHINSESAVPDESQIKREKRLFMCAEMRKLQNDSIIPQSVLDNLTRPCTAVVLWTPPPRIFPPLGSDENRNNPSDEMDSQSTVAKPVSQEPEPEEIELDVESSAVANEMDFDL